MFSRIIVQTFIVSSVIKYVFDSMHNALDYLGTCQTLTWLFVSHHDVLRYFLIPCSFFGTSLQEQTNGCKFSIFTSCNFRQTPPVISTGLCGVWTLTCLLAICVVSTAFVCAEDNPFRLRSLLDGPKHWCWNIDLPLTCVMTKYTWVGCICMLKNLNVSLKWTRL